MKIDGGAPTPMLARRSIDPLEALGVRGHLVVAYDCTGTVHLVAERLGFETAERNCEDSGHSCRRIVHAQFAVDDGDWREVRLAGWDRDIDGATVLPAPEDSKVADSADLLAGIRGGQRLRLRVTPFASGDAPQEVWLMLDGAVSPNLLACR